MTTREAATPLMQQYREIKARHQDAILFFRMGDFYEMFYEDAEVASRVLGLTLTARHNGGASDVPLAGVPVKAVNEYLRRLVRQGFRVAICEQVEDPRVAKGIVRREVIETITPGAAFADDLLDGDAQQLSLCALIVREATMPGSPRPTSPPASCGSRPCPFRTSTPSSRGSRQRSWSCRGARGLRAPRAIRLVTRTRSSPSASRGSSTRTLGATRARAGSSACTRWRGSASVRRTTLRSPQPARCSAICASCSPAACRISRVRWSNARARRCPSTR